MRRKGWPTSQSKGGNRTLVTDGVRLATTGSYTKISGGLNLSGHARKKGIKQVAPEVVRLTVESVYRKKQQFRLSSMRFEGRLEGIVGQAIRLT